MNNSGEQQIVPGILISASGQATVDPALADVLFDLAVKLEEPTSCPVDVQHVLAAVVLAVRNGDLAQGTKLSAEDLTLVEVLAPHVKAVFDEYDGRLGTDD
jgi:hypothetical protein